MKNNNKIPSYPEVKPLTMSAKRLVIFLHGYGSDGDDLISLVPFMQKDLPDCHFISPHGVEPFESAPYGRQWFSLNERNVSVVQQLTASSAKTLQQIIKAKQQELGLTNKDTIIIGFSQGTMLGLYTTLIQDEPFAAMIGFSGRLISPLHCQNIKTPICLIHGEDDVVVDISEMEQTSKYLDQYGVIYNTLSIPNLMHSIDASGIEYAVNFIQQNTW